MKIGIITFHFSHNNGALLQCFALTKYLQSLGHEVKVIDYRPRYHAQMFVPNPNPFVMAHRAYMEYEDKNIAYRIYRYIKRVLSVFAHRNDSNSEARKIQGKAWESFANDFFPLTKTYESIEDLRKDPPKCDVYISGSDQLWNPYLTNFGLDEAYYLNFGMTSTRRITYAVSPCLLDVHKYSIQLKSLLRKLDSISLREQEKLSELESIYGKNISVCPDPTLLLNPEDYGLIKGRIPEKGTDYILIYLMHDEKHHAENDRTIRFIKEKLLIPVIDISMEKRSWTFDVIYHGNVNVYDFLEYIRNASFIVTSSFHCSVFSTMFKKQFITLSLSGKASRTKELLASFNMSNRFITNEGEATTAMSKDIDYSKTESYRIKLQEVGRQYLNSELK